MKKLLLTLALGILVAATGCAQTELDHYKDTGVGKNGVALLSSPSFKKDGMTVDMFNIVRAETAKYFAEETILSGGNKMRHERTGIDLKNQTVIRSNFDLIYSYGVYDISGGLEVKVPEYDLYHIVQIFDENHVTIAVVYPGDTVKLTKDDVTYGDHVYLFMRTQRRTPDEKGLKELNKRQDAVIIKSGSSEPYVSEVKYDPETFNKLRSHLIGPYGINNAIIYKGFVDDLEGIVFPHYQMVNLGGWAGLPAKHAFYFVVVPGDEKSKKGEPSSMTFTLPPVQYGKNGYWSLTLYNEQGWVATEKFNTNSHKATPNADGSYTLHFNTPGAINNLDVVENWNGLFRCYLPDSVDEVLEFKSEVMKALPKSGSTVSEPIKLPKYSADVPESIMTPDVVQTERLGELRFFDGMPSKETVKKVYDNLDFSRGIETFQTGIPAASQYAFIRGMKEAGMGTYSMGIHENLIDARSLWLTPNTTVVYCIAEINVKNGPTVMEVPPGVLGPVDDGYFRWVTDVGFTGPDKGKGGKYLFLPPDYKGDVPEGYFVAKSKTYRNYVLMRAFVIDGDLKKTAAHVKKHWRLYPLAKADNQLDPHFVDLSGLKYNTIHDNDFGFFEELDEVIQYEPADAFNPELVGLWASIGIKKGKSFAPDARMKKILTDAAAVGNATARALMYSPRNKDVYFYDDRQWYTCFVGGSHEFMDNGELVRDLRTFMHYGFTGITPAMSYSEVGKGSAYAFTGVDSERRYLDGGNTYKVTLPGPVPAKDFWSFVIYSGQHRSLLETDQKLAGIDNKNTDVQANSDGSFTIWFGPKPPEGKESNWVQTMPDKSWSVLLRLYGPLEGWFDKTWKPGDFELIK